MVSSQSGTARTDRTLLQLVVGVVFILVGIIGFVPGITTHYSDMTFAGHNSMAKLVGLFIGLGCPARPPGRDGRSRLTDLST